MRDIHVGPLSLTVHRTVRVPDGRAPASLPPSRGRATVYKVSDFRSACPSTGEDDGVFVGVHDHEAIWFSFDRSAPAAVVIGAGGVNAITGQPLSPSPVAAEDYSGGYFDVRDGEMEDVPSSSAFVGLESVFHGTCKP